MNRLIELPVKYGFEDEYKTISEEYRKFYNGKPSKIFLAAMKLAIEVENDEELEDQQAKLSELKAIKTQLETRKLQGEEVKQTGGYLWDITNGRQTGVEDSIELDSLAPRMIKMAMAIILKGSFIES